MVSGGVVGCGIVGGAAGEWELRGQGVGEEDEVGDTSFWRVGKLLPFWKGFAIIEASLCPTSLRFRAERKCGLFWLLLGFLME